MILVTPMAVERFSSAAKLYGNCQGRDLPGWGEEQASTLYLQPPSWITMASSGNMNWPPRSPLPPPFFPLVVTPAPRDGHALGPSTPTHQNARCGHPCTWHRQS